VVFFLGVSDGGTRLFSCCFCVIERFFRTRPEEGTYFILYIILFDFTLT